MIIIRKPFAGIACLLLLNAAIFFAPNATLAQTIDTNFTTSKGSLFQTAIPGSLSIDSTLFSDNARQNFLRKAAHDLEQLKNSIHPNSFLRIPLNRKSDSSNLSKVDDTSLLHKFYKKDVSPSLSKKSVQLVKFNGGYIQYNWSYQSGLNSPYVESDLSQHLLSATASFTLVNTLPVRINYYGRETNSPYFKNYRDVKIDIDVEEYQRLRKQKLLASLKSSIQELKDPLLPYALGASRNQLTGHQHILDDPKVIKKLIESKEVLLKGTFLDTSFTYKDSLYKEAKNFISFYDSLQNFKRKYESLQDSLQLVMQAYESKIRSVDHLINGAPLSTKELVELSSSHQKSNREIKKILQASDGIRLFSIGRTFPSYSNLTLQNVNVNGLNVEYRRKALFLVAAAGSVDFRIRDFLFENERKPIGQYVYFGKIGYGKKEYNHIAIAYFTGRKQFIGSTQQGASGTVQGFSLSAQLFLNKYIRLYGELAQSGSSSINSNSSIQKSTIRFNDDSQQAYAFSLNSYLPQTQTRVEGHFQKTGINYQCFNNFQYNAAVSSWSGKIEQSVWKRQFTVLAAVRKNDFSNPFLLQRYNANAIFKTAMLTFRKQNWPMISLGYLPTSQNIAIGSQVFENHFQALTGHVSYQYTVGLAKSSSTLIYSRFYNESNDSGFVYFNSKNIFWNQSFAFDLFSINVGASAMHNNQYQLTVLDGGIHTMVFKTVNLDLGVKVNHLKSEDTKFGFKTGGGFVLKNIGEISVWMEKSYLPAEQNKLSKYEMYNLGFTRFFK